LLYKSNAMIQETKIYSDFIKANKVKVSKDFFIYNSEEIMICQDDMTRKWHAGQDDGCYTKKAAIYYYIKNRM
jgi:hypothetical protein